MQTTNIAIWVLSVLDTGLLVMIPLLDRRCYGEFTNPSSHHFFCNTAYDDAFNRFMLSKCGLMIMALSIMTMPFLAGFNYGA